ncbi:MAG: nucleotidyltransferase family protein [Ferruginibacter sp.]|nr:nucleotidyltransferase family protein [Ferruginibacter sp.]
MEAIILAGGLGTRLRSAVPDMPKCMAPVNGIPFLSFVIAHLQKNGIEHFIFSLGYKSEMITRFLDTNYQHMRKIYVVENEQCGTGGAIKKACKFVVAKNVIVVNGDTLFTIDIGKLISVHNKHNADCTIALKLLKNCSRYGTVTVNSQSLVKAFAEKNQHGQGYINGGIYALHVNSFLNEALPVKFSFEKDWLEKKFGIKKFYGVKNNKYFIDIGVQEDYERAKAELINVKI